MFRLFLGTIDAVGIVGTTGIGPNGLPAGPVTASAAGVVAVSGVTSKTLGAMTLSGTGGVAGGATLTATLAGLSRTITGTVSLSGSATKTLGACTVSAAGTSGSVNPHAYFESLLAHSAFWKAYSLRPVPGVTDPEDPYWVNQLTEEDSGGGFGAQTIGKGFEPHPWEYDATEDAARLTMPPFVDVSGMTLQGGGVSSGATVLTFDNVVGTFSVGRSIKIDNEVMLIGARVTGVGGTLTVTRGHAGTTPAAHSAGALTRLLTNTSPSKLIIPLNTNNEVNHFFFVWDTKHTDSFVGNGLTNHKTYQIASGFSAIWFEPNTVYSPDPEQEGDYVDGVDVSATQVRGYGSVIAPPTTDDEPLEPQAGTFTIKPNKWTRYFALLRVKSKTDPTAFFNSGATLTGALGAVGISGVTLNTTMTTSTTALSFTSAASAVDFETAFPVGGYVGIDDEAMLITAVDGTAKTMTVTRAQLSTGPTAHAVGVGVYVAVQITANATSLYGAAVVAGLNRRLNIKIDSEIIRTITHSGSETSPRTMTVLRGYAGTTAAAHSSGAAIYHVANVTASFWVADEDRDPVKILDNLLISTHGEELRRPTLENSLVDFEYEWNTSNDTAVARSEPPVDLVVFHRNWAALKGTTLDPESEGLLERPNATEDEPSGTLSKTLGALTASSAGTVALSGLTAKTLTQSTVTSAGTVSLSGATTSTLASLTMSASGLVGLTGIVGELSRTLANASILSAGAAEVAGSVEATLQDVAATVQGQAAVSGTLDLALEAATVVSVAVEPISGTLSLTLQPVTASAGDIVPALPDVVTMVRPWIRVIRVRRSQ